VGDAETQHTSQVYGDGVLGIFIWRARPRITDRKLDFQWEGIMRPKKIAGYRKISLNKPSGCVFSRSVWRYPLMLIAI